MKNSWLDEEIEKDKKFLFSINPLEEFKFKEKSTKFDIPKELDSFIEKEKPNESPKETILKEPKKMRKISSITDKKKCKNFEKCPETSNEEHKEKYYHLCTIKDCKKQDNELHINRFVHRCTKKNCTNSDSIHQLQFIHTLILPLCKTPIKCQDKSKNHFKEFKHICSDLKCVDSKEKDHRAMYIHHCQYGNQCKSSDNNHSKDFIHPCKYGSKCEDILNIEHILMFSHDKSPQIELLKWPSCWMNPSPPKPETLKGNHYKIITLSSTNQEYIDTENKFKQYLPNKSVTSIERVENYNLWILYSKKRDTLEKYSKEMQLFHGTDAKSITLISELGFDCRHGSLSGKYGAGIYFSPDSAYSDSYAKGSGKMFLARFAPGDCVTKQHTMGGIRKAEKNPNTGRDYDTIIYYNQKEYIGYDNHQAYPEYIITYK